MTRAVVLLLLLVPAACVREGNDPPRRNHLVTIATEPGGSVASTPPGIACGAVCTGSFAHGSVLTLEPRPEAGVRFTGWSGACAGKGLCMLTVNDDLRAGATFELEGGGKVPPDRPTSSDLDKDGVLDGVDQCPVDSEDVDGVADADGCPEPDPPEPDPPLRGGGSGGGTRSGGGTGTGGGIDGDGDGLPDASDKCPGDPEDLDGFEDADGCPDPDNDQDGILDVDDLCPNVAENLNGFQDDDGCPDRT